MTAELLRRAAKEMRQAATAATPGPWEAQKVYDEVYGIWPVPVMDADDPQNHPDECSRATRENAEHIASWYPAVAFAVADWLDAEAAIWPLAEKLGDVPKGTIRVALSTLSAAESVARAYLGEEAG